MTGSRPRRVLMVAYHFHPDLAVGAMRSVKFAKYLPEFGWEPHVVTVNADRYERLDATPLPFPCDVHRSGQWPTIAALGSRLARAIIPSRKNPGGSADGAVRTLPSGGAVWTLPSSFLRRLVALLSMMPDVHVGWLVPGTWLAIRVARQEKVEVIYTLGSATHRPPRRLARQSSDWPSSRVRLPQSLVDRGIPTWARAGQRVSQAPRQMA